MRTLELVVSSHADGTYLVSAHSAEGDTSQTPAKFPYSERELARVLRDVELSLVRSAATNRRVPGKDEQPVQALGAELFAFLFPGPVRDHLTAMRGQAARDDDAVQLRLRIRPPELAALPWELIYDAGRDDYLCLSTPLVRYLEVLEPVKPLTVTGAVRVLGMVARPGALSELDAEHEKRWLDEALAALSRSGQVELTWTKGQTWRDLQDGLDRVRPNVVHFIGHGGFDEEIGEGLLALAGEDGDVHRLAASDLGLLLGERRSLRLVVLNSCEGARASGSDVFSSTAAVLTRRGIPAVVAMQYEISDQAATAFARALYGAIATGFGVDQAVTRARRDIKISRGASLEWATPVLYLRSPDPRLFDLTQPPPNPQIPVAATPAPQESEQQEQATHSPPSQDDSPESPRPQPSQADSPRTRIEPGSLLIQIDVGSAVTALAFSPDGIRLVTASSDNIARTWDTSTGRELTRMTHDGPITAVAFSPEGTRLATVDEHGAAFTWDVATGQQVTRIRRMFIGWAVAFSPDGARLATAGMDNTVRIWDTIGRELIHMRHNLTKIRPDAALAVAFSPDGTRLATASSDNTARIWDTTTGRELTRMTHDSWVWAVAYSPDGTRLATASFDETARTWDTTTGHQLTRMTHEHRVHVVTYSPDGTRLATASEEDTARTWDTTTGRELTRMTHEDQVRTVAFSPDGTRLATASDDHTARAWDTTTGRELTRMTHERPVRAAVFSPGGTRLATRADDHFIRIWAV